MAQHVKSFPINLKTVDEKLKDELKKLVDELMKSYDRNSNTKINERTGGYAIKIKETIPSRSKEIIDQIDDVFAEHFDFTEKEKEFIKKFDQEFRLESTETEE